MKLNSIEIHNYKSLRNINFTPSPLVTLIGPNASGKSNFCDALDFVGEAYRLGLEIAVARKGGYENICYRHFRRSKAPISFHIQFEIPFDRDVWPFYYSSVKRSRIKGKNIVFDHSFQFRAESESIKSPFYVSSENIVVRLKPTKDSSQQLPLIKGSEGQNILISYSRKRNEITQADFEGFEKLLGHKEFQYFLPFIPGHVKERKIGETISSTDLMISILERFFWGNFPFRQNIGSLRVFQLSPVSCRESGVPTPNPELGRFGSNLPAVIEFLKSHHKDRYSMLLNTIKRVMPTLLDIDTQYTHTKTLGLFVSESGFGQPWASGDISDGTVQTIALLSAIFDPRTSIVVIEEPENSVHAWALRNFMKAAREASTTKQVILTTHSPILIDQQKPSELWVVSRPHSETFITPAIKLNQEILTNWERGISTLSEYLDSGAIPEALPLEET